MDVVAVVETDNGLGKDEAVSRAELKVVFKRAAWYSLALTLAVAVLGELVFPMIQSLKLRQVAVPIPMFFSHYVFSKGFFTAWVIISFVWVFCSSFVSCFLPIWETRGFFVELWRAVGKDVWGRRRH